ncbi:class I SAM-dependent methyltransferase [Altericista sp. CCNU0014]|uniref:class I SAM-dependent methyltransferase n=1 Tax=Altericista sp. CCNU0014 TaxID=3082949 RepID=UPI0038513FCE
MQTAFDFNAIANFNPLKTAYQALQWSKNIFGLAHKNASTQVGKTLFPANSVAEGQARPVIDEKVLAYLKMRYEALLEQDWNDAQAGFYPIDLLFDTPWDEVARYYPAVWLDLPLLWQRAQSKRYQDFSAEIDTSGYPKYYLQNFHYQTDGYLSDTSAKLYDLQVELLFGGMADPMRRRILPLLKRFFARNERGNSPKILDVACGTGRTLRQLRAAFPKVSLYGVDLSPAYLRKANRLLSQNPGELPQLLQANAEALPYQDSYFDAVASVFLFHELPGTARQNVIDECYRVLQPGGMLVICDSIQLHDSKELSPMMEGFSSTFHEPYYKDYIHDDLTQRLESAGFTDIACEAHYLSTYFTACKPL